MSTIRVDSFGPSAGGTTYSARGIARAWVNFDGTGTIAARDSENVSSLTDNGTGDYTVNFSNAFGAADYSIVVTGNGGSTTLRIMGSSGADPASGSCRLQAFTFGGSLADALFPSTAFHGDLA
jgi:hypothetical protein